MSKRNRGETEEPEALEGDPVAMNPVIVEPTTIAAPAVPAAPAAPTDEFVLTRRVTATISSSGGTYWSPDPKSGPEYKPVVLRSELEPKNLDAFVRSGALKPKR